MEDVGMQRPMNPGSMCTPTLTASLPESENNCGMLVMMDNSCYNWQMEDDEDSQHGPWDQQRPTELEMGSRNVASQNLTGGIKGRSPLPVAAGRQSPSVALDADGFPVPTPRRYSAPRQAEDFRTALPSVDVVPSGKKNIHEKLFLPRNSRYDSQESRPDPCENNTTEYNNRPFLNIWMHATYRHQSWILLILFGVASWEGTAFLQHPDLCTELLHFQSLSHTQPLLCLLPVQPRENIGKAAFYNFLKILQHRAEPQTSYSLEIQT